MPVSVANPFTLPPPHPPTPSPSHPLTLPPPHSLERKAYINIVNESEKFEEIITMEAIRQENLIAAAKKNVMRFGKLARMGGSASTEHNDRSRRGTKVVSENAENDVKRLSASAGNSAKVSPKRGARATIVSKVQAFIKEPDRNAETKKEKRERSVREQERSVRRTSSLSHARVHGLDMDELIEEAQQRLSSGRDS